MASTDRVAIASGLLPSWTARGVVGACDKRARAGPIQNRVWSPSASGLAASQAGPGGRRGREAFCQRICAAELPEQQALRERSSTGCRYVPTLWPTPVLRTPAA